MRNQANTKCVCVCVYTYYYYIYTYYLKMYISTERYHCLLFYVSLPSCNKPWGDICQAALSSSSSLQPCGLSGGDVPCVFTQSLGGAHLAAFCPLMSQQGCSECPAPHVTCGAQVCPGSSIPLPGAMLPACTLAGWGSLPPEDHQCSMWASEVISQYEW